jgi:hypothetical protein
MLSLGVGNFNTFMGNGAGPPENFIGNKHARSRKTEAYREALQLQMEQDNERRKETNDTHPLECQVQKHIIRPAKLEDLSDSLGFFIGEDQKDSTEKKKQAILMYKAQLDRDAQKTKFTSPNDNIVYDRKPVIRKISTPPSGEFNIGGDEALTRQRKKQETLDFYHAQNNGNKNTKTKNISYDNPYDYDRKPFVRKISTPVVGEFHIGGDDTADRQRRKNDAIAHARSQPQYTSSKIEPKEDTSGFFIGADEKDLSHSKHMKQLQYRDALDTQVRRNEEQSQLLKDKLREEDYNSSLHKLPYARH